MKAILIFLFFAGCLFSSFADVPEDTSKKAIADARSAVQNAKDPADRARKMLLLAKAVYNDGKNSDSALSALKVLDMYMDEKDIPSAGRFQILAEKMRYMLSYEQLKKYYGSMIGDATLSADQITDVHIMFIECARKLDSDDFDLFEILNSAESDKRLSPPQLYRLLVFRTAQLDQARQYAESLASMQKFNMPGDMPSRTMQDYLCRLGNAYLKSCRYNMPPSKEAFERAIESFKKALDVPDCNERAPEILLALAQAEFDSGDFEAATATVRKLLVHPKISGTEGNALYLLARISLETGDYQAAYDAMRSALEKQKKIGGQPRDHYFALASAAFALKKYPEALAALEKASEASGRKGALFYGRYIANVKSVIAADEKTH